MAEVAMFLTTSNPNESPQIVLSTVFGRMINVKRWDLLEVPILLEVPAIIGGVVAWFQLRVFFRKSFDMKGLK